LIPPENIVDAQLILSLPFLPVTSNANDEQIRGTYPLPERLFGFRNRRQFVLDVWHSRALNVGSRQRHSCPDWTVAIGEKPTCMLPVDWGVAIRYAGLVKIAESLAPSGSYSQTQLAAIKAVGYSYLQTVYADDLATDIDPHIGEVVSFGFLAVSDARELVVVLRGTDTILEWLHDGSFLMAPSPVVGAPGLTEDGFTAVYRSLRSGVATGTLSVKDSIKTLLDRGTASSVTVCGHSLGGALATLLTLDVKLNTSCNAPIVYTYASPRVGDHIFAGSYNAAIPASYRIANRQDLVTQLPSILPLPYEHVNQLYELNPPPNAIDPAIPCMHHLTTYLWMMSQLAGSSGYPLDGDCVFTKPLHI
jgi:Lipase (class 3)